MKLVGQRRASSSRRARSAIAWGVWRKRLVTLPTVLGALCFLLGLALLGVWPEGSRPEPVSISIDAPSTPESREVQRPLTSYNQDLLERTTYVTLEVPDDPQGDLLAIIAALREELRAEGIWPEELPEPQLFLPELTGGERVAVLDFALREAVYTSITQERRLLESLKSTLRRNDIDRLHIMIDGRPSPTFLGHIALPQALD